MTLLLRLTCPTPIAPLPFTVMPDAPMVKAVLENVSVPVVALPLPTVIPAMRVVPVTGLTNARLLKSAVSWVRLFAGATLPTQFEPVLHVAALLPQVISLALVVKPKVIKMHVAIISDSREEFLARPNPVGLFKEDFMADRFGLLVRRQPATFAKKLLPGEGL